jgi:hypothetical protein
MAHVNSRKILILMVLISPFLFIPSVLHADPAIAADCVESACIDVYTLNGEIIIEGRKGAKTTVKPRPKVTFAPKPRKTLAPRPQQRPTTAAKPQPKVTVYPRPRKKTVHKSVPKTVKKAPAGISLNDRLVKLLPMASIARQPVKNAIVKVPVIYWCNLPEVFMTKVAIVGEVIDVTMRPSFLWSFGDGSFYATTKPGAAFPHQIISHTYSHSGIYLVTMLATWGGTWTHNGVARAITGEVRKISISLVTVANGPIRITE